MLRPLDAKLHYRSRQDVGEYFGKDCGKHSVPRGQGQNSGIIITAQDVYPCIIPYKQRQVYELNKEYATPRKGDRPMHATTMQYRPVKPMFTSTTKHEFGGRRDLMPARRPHGCRSMHTSQIVFGKEPGFQRSSTYSGEFKDKYSQPHEKILQPVLDNKATSIGSRDITTSLQPQKHTNYFTQYGISHNKLGAMLDISKPKYEIPISGVKTRHYNVLTESVYNQKADTGVTCLNPSFINLGQRLLFQGRLSPSVQVRTWGHRGVLITRRHLVTESYKRPVKERILMLSVEKASYYQNGCRVSHTS